MSKRKQENVSVSDIVAEMRDTCHNPTLGIKTDREKSLEKFLKDIMIEYADRIEAAYKRENVRLLAALKPVLDIEMDMYTSNLSMEMAINETKRIYNEGEK